MKLQTGFSMATLILMASGCLGGGGDCGDHAAGSSPPQRPPPTGAFAAGIWTGVTLRVPLIERESLTGEFETNFAPVAAGTSSFAYDELHERDSLLALLAGTVRPG